jgi:Fanconi anemia group J protein
MNDENGSAYEAPVFTNDDEFDIDMKALVDDNHELSPEGNIAQVLDGVEWEDWEDDDDLMAQAVRATQTTHTVNKAESATPIEHVSVCAKCGNARHSHIDTESDDKVTLMSPYLDNILQTEVGFAHEFVVVDMRGECCVAPPSERVEFDRDLRIAFSRVTSCDGDRLIGLRVEATNVAYAHLCERVLLPRRTARPWRR